MILSTQLRVGACVPLSLSGRGSGCGCAQTAAHRPVRIKDLLPLYANVINNIQHTLQMLMNLIVIETKHLHASRFKVGRPARIMPLAKRV